MEEKTTFVNLVVNHSLKKELKAHINSIHDRHKDYKCDPCGKFFSRAGPLKKHIYTIHEDHKDYKCNSCGKSFSQARYLKRHSYSS